MGHYRPARWLRATLWQRQPDGRDIPVKRRSGNSGAARRFINYSADPVRDVAAALTRSEGQTGRRTALHLK